jgi:Ca-activated chloride channel family protein
MRRRAVPFVLAGLAAFAAALPTSALDVLLLSPRSGQPAFGEVEVRADVLSAAPVAELVVRVDGRIVARLSQPPWRVEVDVGQDNVGHRFEVEVRDAEGATATAAATTTAVRVDEEIDLELQQLYVTVRDPRPRDLGLERGAFRVLDDGKRQEIVTFERGDAPLTAVVLVDTSDSMHGDKLDTAIRGAEVFLYGLRDLDEARLTLFSDRRIRDSEFSRHADDVTYGLGDAPASGGTALNDHLYYALRLLDGRQGRRVVIVLSDGIDTDSLLGADDVRWAARRSQAMIYWIRLHDPRTPGTYSSSWRNREEQARELEVLARTVTESGGTVHEIADVGGAASAFREILEELRRQFVLGYYPSRNQDDGSWHALEVVLRGRDVRTRDGYIDY